jgi:hypothetical protein
MRAGSARERQADLCSDKTLRSTVRSSVEGLSGNEGTVVKARERRPREIGSTLQRVRALQGRKPRRASRLPAPVETLVATNGLRTRSKALKATLFVLARHRNVMRARAAERQAGCVGGKSSGGRRTPGVPAGRNRPARSCEEKAVKRVRNPEGGKAVGQVSLPPGAREPSNRSSGGREVDSHD